MDALVLSVQIPQDHHLVLDLPADVPVGQAEVIIKPQAAAPPPIINSAREAARAKLMAAGKLVTDLHPPEGTVPLSVTERKRLGQLAAGAHPSEDLINEDRGNF